MNKGVQKVTDEHLIDVLKNSTSIRQALIEVGLTPKGDNHTRAKRLMKKHSISLLKNEPVTERIYKTGTKTLISPCPVCGKYKKKGLKYCSPECSSISQRRVERPSLEQLEELRKNHTMVAIGKMFGVCDTTIRKWMKKVI